MKGKFKIGLLLFACITLVGCKNTSNNIADYDLNDINNQIIEYFTSDNVEYDNLGFNYIDEEKNIVVVGLVDNSKEQQEKFKELVIDSDLIVFVQGQSTNDINK